MKHIDRGCQRCFSACLTSSNVGVMECIEVWDIETIKKKGGEGKLATKGFGVDQVWAQLSHYTERANQQAINSLNALVGSEDFLRGLDQLSEGEDENTMMDAESEEAEGEDQSEEGEAEIDEGDYGEEKEAEDDEEKDSNTEEIEDFLDDQDSEEEMRDQIKIPSDIEDAEDEYGGEDEESQEEGEAEVDEDEEFGQFAEEDDVENDVFNLAKENNEMGDPKSLNKGMFKAKVEEAAAGALSTKKAVEYANKEMIGRIEKLEDSMVGGQQNSAISFLINMIMVMSL